MPPDPATSGRSAPARSARPGRIPMNRIVFDEDAERAVVDVLRSGRVAGVGPELEAVEELLERRLGVRNALLTTSCTHALEAMIAAHGIGEGDEVIVPAYAFPSTASCVLQAGARVVFADSRADEPNVDPEDVAGRITPRTRALVLLHYGGIACDMDALWRLAADHGLLVLEDAAHGLDARFRERHLGNLGAGGCLSFHGTKNVTCGEGGVLLVEDDEVAERARTIREMGTDRFRFRAGEVRSYQWRALGSSYAPSEIVVALLRTQLERADAILARRRALFFRYQEAFREPEARGLVVRPRLPADAFVNGHLYYLVLPDAEAAAGLRSHLDGCGIDSAPHYHPLDRSEFGRTLLPPGTGPAPNAAELQGCLLRLPLYQALSDDEHARVVGAVLEALPPRSASRPRGRLTP